MWCAIVPGLQQEDEAAVLGVSKMQRIQEDAMNGAISVIPVMSVI